MQPIKGDPVEWTAIDLDKEIEELQAALQKMEGIVGTVETTPYEPDRRPIASHKVKAAKKRKAKRKRGGPQ